MLPSLLATQHTAGLPEGWQGPPNPYRTGQEASQAVRGTASDIVSRLNLGLFSTKAAPVYEPQIDPRLAQNRREIQAANDKYQALFERLMSAAEERAALKRVPPVLQNMAPEEAQRMMGILAAAQMLGARGQHVQSAGQNYREGVQQRNQVQYLNDQAQSQADYEYQQQQANLPISQVEAQMGMAQNEIRGLQSERDNIYRAINVELQQAGLNSREQLKDSGRRDLQRQKLAFDAALAQYKDEASAISRLRDSIFVMFKEQGESDEDAMFFANLYALSPHGLRVAQAENTKARTEGVNFDNQLKEATLEDRIREAKARADKTERDAEYGAIRNELYPKEVAAKLAKLAADTAKARAGAGPKSATTNLLKDWNEDIKSKDALVKALDREIKDKEAELKRIMEGAVKGLASNPMKWGDVLRMVAADSEELEKLKEERKALVEQVTQMRRDGAPSSAAPLDVAGTATLSGPIKPWAGPPAQPIRR